MVAPSMCTDMENKYPNAIIVQDAVEADGYVNYQVRNSYQYDQSNVQNDVCSMIIQYNSDAGRTESWDRSQVSCVAEWIEHNALYYIPNEDIKDRARHVDLDADAHGTPAEIFD